ncbi:hypothetical protein ACO2Q9_03865 [Variovorax sp. VNK109]|uniref:hypothetical protein n=1 Tax=Variovorax sp. VNK109 TaxID=3400919 RepID=UPI003BFC91F5
MSHDTDGQWPPCSNCGHEIPLEEGDDEAVFTEAEFICPACGHRESYDDMFQG